MPSWLNLIKHSSFQLIITEIVAALEQEEILDHNFEKMLKTSEGKEALREEIERLEMITRQKAVGWSAPSSTNQGCDIALQPILWNIAYYFSQLSKEKQQSFSSQNNDLSSLSLDPSAFDLDDMPLSDSGDIDKCFDEKEYSDCSYSFSNDSSSTLSDSESLADLMYEEPFIFLDTVSFKAQRIYSFLYCFVLMQVRFIARMLLSACATLFDWFHHIYISSFVRGSKRS